MIVAAEPGLAAGHVSPDHGRRRGPFSTQNRGPVSVKIDRSEHEVAPRNQSGLIPPLGNLLPPLRNTRYRPMDQTARRRTTIQIRGAGTALSVFRLIASSYRNRRRNHPRKPLKVLTVRAPSIYDDTPVKGRDHQIGHRLAVYAG